MMAISTGFSAGDGRLGKPAMMTLATLSVAEHLDSVARLDTDESAKHRRWIGVCVEVQTYGGVNMNVHSSTSSLSRT